MTRVGELLAAVAESAPVRRVRNYYRSDREASPRPRDFLTAMKRSDGAVCVRLANLPGGCASEGSSEFVSDGDCFVRYADSVWECARYDRIRDRTAVEAVDADVVTEWLQNADPELVAYEGVREAFEGECVDTTHGASEGDEAVTDGGPPPGVARRVRVEQYADLLADPHLDSRDADALAAVLPVAPGEIAFRLPLVLAEESVLESVAGSDSVFVAEPVPERETEFAHYVRQSHRGCWVPKGERTVYELPDGATVRPESPAGEANEPLESEIV